MNRNKKELFIIAQYLEISFQPNDTKDKLVSLINQKVFNMAPPEIPQSETQLELARIQLALKEQETRQAELQIQHETRQAEIQAEREREARQAEILLRQAELDHQYRMQCGNVRPNDSSNTFDVAKNVRLVPVFNESDVTKYVQVFEKVADGFKWPKEHWTILLQSD